MTRASSRSSEWATFGRDLLVSTGTTPRGQWTTHLSHQIREAIRNGVLRPGVKLPSTRALAADLRLSRGVVLAVYDQLKAEGYLSTTPGSGTTVADTGPGNAGSAPSTTPCPISPPASPGLPDPNLFPRHDWLKAYRRALQHLPDADLHYGDPRGYEPLRAELVDYLGRVRGLRATHDQILIVNGFAQGLAILARVLAEHDITTVAVEEPGSTGTRRQLNDWGIATPPADVDEHGLSIDSLEATGAPAVLLTPAHHYPTGVVLTPERRHQLLDWVHRKPGRYIVEDDYDAEYRYDHQPVGSLQPLNPERIITGSSVSKTLAPALRLGWLVVPDHLLAETTKTKAILDLGTSILTQAALVELLRTGTFDRHLRRSRLTYRTKRRHVAHHLTTELPNVTISGLEAGLNICLRLDGLTNDQPLTNQLKAQGVRCEALSYYQQRPTPQQGLVLDIAATTDHHLALITSTIHTSTLRKPD